MTWQEENSTFYDVLKLLTADGFDGQIELKTIVMYGICRNCLKI